MMPSSAAPVVSPLVIKALLAEIRAGSKDAMALLIEQYQPFLLAIAKRSIPAALAGKVSPSDVIQETSIDALKAIDRLRADTDAECQAWLRTLLANNIRDASRKFIFSDMRQVGREQSLSSGDSRSGTAMLPSVQCSPLDVMLAQEEQRQVQQALRCLDAAYREVIELVSRDRLSFDEIGQRLNKTSGAVRMLWNRAVKRLAAELRHVQ